MQIWGLISIWLQCSQEHCRNASVTIQDLCPLNLTRSESLRRPAWALCAAWCTDLYTRTNIELDDALVKRAMKVYQASTKRAVVELALRRLVETMERKELLKREGAGWQGDLEAVRDDANC